MKEGNYIKLNGYLASITTILSFFGTLAIIISFFAWKDIRTASRRILVYISAADFLTSVATITAMASFWIKGKETKDVCSVQSILGTFSVLSSFFWTVFMALYLYIAICRKNVFLAKRLLLPFHVCGWGIPAVIVCGAFFGKKLGNNDNKVTSGWCWINEDLNWPDQVLWMLLAGKLWEIMAYFTIVVLYALVKRSMKKERAGLLTYNDVMQAQKVERKLICIPLIFVFLRIWGTIRFFLLVAKGPKYKSTSDLLLILQGIGDNAPGFANFLLFFLFTEKCLGNFRLWITCNSTCFSRNNHCPSSSMAFRDTSQEPLVQHNKINNKNNPSLLDSKNYLAI